MKGIVWGNTWERAQKQLEKIREDYARHKIDVEWVKRSNTHQAYAIKYKNGDYWMATSAKENMRGARCNISYIDNEIDEDFIYCVIDHCTTAGPWHGFCMYG